MAKEPKRKQEIQEKAKLTEAVKALQKVIRSDHRPR